MSSEKMVTYDQLMVPLMKALVNLGGRVVSMKSMRL